MQTFSTRLKETLEERGVSPAQFARKVGMSRAGVWLWLHNRCETPRSTELLKAAQFLNVSAAWLLHGKKNGDTMNKGITMKNQVEQRLDRLARFLTAWQDLTVAEQQHFADLIEQAAARNRQEKAKPKRRSKPKT